MTSPARPDESRTSRVLLRRRRIASDAARGVPTSAFEDLGLDEAVGSTTTTDERSQTVMRRIGKTRAPRRTSTSPIRGRAAHSGAASSTASAAARDSIVHGSGDPAGRIP